MVGFVDEESVYQLWLDYFTLKDLTKVVRYTADRYPEVRSLEVDFKEILGEAYLL